MNCHILTFLDLIPSHLGRKIANFELHFLMGNLWNFYGASNVELLLLCMCLNFFLLKPSPPKGSLIFDTFFGAFFTLFKSRTVEKWDVMKLYTFQPFS